MSPSLLLLLFRVLAGLVRSLELSLTVLVISTGEGEGKWGEVGEEVIGAPQAVVEENIPLLLALSLVESSPNADPSLFLSLLYEDLSSFSVSLIFIIVDMLLVFVSDLFCFIFIGVSLFMTLSLFWLFFILSGVVF